MATLPYQVVFYPFGKPQEEKIEYFAKPQAAIKYAVSVLQLGSSPRIERNTDKGWERAVELEKLMAQQVQKKALAAQKKGLRELERLNDLTTVLHSVVKKGPLEGEQKLELLQAMIAVTRSLDLEQQVTQPEPLPENPQPHKIEHTVVQPALNKR
jgi:hypothetical protein